MSDEAKAKAAEIMVAARHAKMFADIRDFLVAQSDAFPEALPLLSSLETFLGEGYTGRVVAFKRVQVVFDELTKRIYEAGFDCGFLVGAGKGRKK